MDTLEQRITISPEVHQQAPKAPMLHLASLSRSSQPEKQSLLTKIKSLHSKNHELAEKQHVLQNTLNDLRKLLKTTATENEEYGRKIEEENAGLADKAARVRGALRAVHSVGRHLEACGLYWREFVE